MPPSATATSQPALIGHIVKIVKPSFDPGKLAQKLAQASTDEERIQLIMRRHYNFFLPPDYEIERMLRALGLPSHVRALRQ